MTAEKWLPVDGFPGYEVSDHRQVRSVARVVPHSRSGSLRLPGRVLKPFKRSSGHLSVNLRRDGITEIDQVHRIVARAFLGPIPNGAHVLHWNDDPTDNRATNLRFGSDSDNSYDAVRNGKHPVAKKTHCKWGHALTEQNTVPSERALGLRSCLSCRRTRAYLQDHPELREQHQAISDRYYAAITRKETTNHV